MKTEKICSRCEETKPCHQYTKNGTATDGFYSMCKDCKRESQNKSKYGVSNKEYNRLLKKQDSKCAICFVDHVSASKSRLYIDHCHTTGKVRGLLCSHCNFVLGQARDNKDTLLSAILYLEEFENDRP